MRGLEEVMGRGYMVKKMVVIAGIILLPGVVGAQIDRIEDLQIKHNEFSVSVNFINMKPINDYIGTYGFSPLTEMPLLFGYAQKNKIGDKAYWGLRFMTTLSGFEVLAPNFLKRELSSGKGTDKVEMFIATGEFLIEYEILKYGGLFLNAGAGLGFGGSKITFLGTNGGRFWMVSFLLKPQASVGYHLFEESGGGFIISLNAAYNYLPVVGWNPDGGNLLEPPGPGSATPFDLSGTSVNISMSFPFTTK